MNGEAAWQDALLAAALLAIDPAGLGGIALRARPGPVRDSWLESTRELFPDLPWRKIPQTVSEARLLGGLDLAATLKAGKPVAQAGLLNECNHGIAVLAMAERCQPTTAAHLCQALDRHEIQVEREGLSATLPAAFALLALDESVESDEQLDAGLAERLAFHLDLHEVGIRDLLESGYPLEDIAAARSRCNAIECDDESTRQICTLCLVLGIDSPRASLLAQRAARAAAALAGSHRVSETELEIAARLVLAPRATRLPATEEEEQETEAEPPPQEPQESEGEQQDPGQGEGMQDRLIEATKAALPEGLLNQLLQGGVRRSSGRGGKSGQMRRSRSRGRPTGTIQGVPRSGARLSPVATLQAAAPWQPLRRGAGDPPRQLKVQRDDFRVVRYRERSESTTVFVVDASGSAALNRLAEAKGAVELLLADCYIRRDQVAMIAFRGETADLLLPPTRSLVRAKRNLAALPGGGGTPLAAAIESAAALATSLVRRGGTPNVVFLTDGRGNIARDGRQGREAAREDLPAVAALFRESGVRGMVIDTSPRPGSAAAELAQQLDIDYLPLPHADASQLSEAVRAASL